MLVKMSVNQAKYFFAFVHKEFICSVQDKLGLRRTPKYLQTNNLSQCRARDNERREVIKRELQVKTKDHIHRLCMSPSTFCHLIREFLTTVALFSKECGLRALKQWYHTSTLYLENFSHSAPVYYLFETGHIDLLQKLEHRRRKLTQYITHSTIHRQITVW